LSRVAFLNHDLRNINFSDTTFNDASMSGADLRDSNLA
jgi:uncharacterized protein YjbI with pentapeptide repeats